MGRVASGILFINPYTRALMTFLVAFDPFGDATQLNIVCNSPLCVISVQAHDGLSWSMNQVYRHRGKVWALEIIRGFAEEPNEVLDEAFEFYKQYYDSIY